MNSLNFNNSNDRKNMAHPYHRCRHDSYLIVIATWSETAKTSHKHTWTTEEILSFWDCFIGNQIEDRLQVLKWPLGCHFFFWIWVEMINKLRSVTNQGWLFVTSQWKTFANRKPKRRVASSQAELYQAADTRHRSERCLRVIWSRLNVYYPLSTKTWVRRTILHSHW